MDEIYEPSKMVAEHVHEPPTRLRVILYKGNRHAIFRFQEAFCEEINMTLSAQQIIESFDHLPESEKQRVAYEILRRSIHLKIPPLTDEELVTAAEDLFLALDARETKNGSSDPGRGLVS